MNSAQAQPDMPVWSWPGAALGARLALPLVPGYIAFGLAVGATAASKGFTLLATITMNAFVYAGASQLIGMEIWPAKLTVGAIISLALIVATVNARMLLMGASLRPWLGPLPWWQSYPMQHLTTDPGWILAMRYRAEGGNDAAMYFANGFVLFWIWMASTTAGYLLGALVSDPRSLGIDLVMPVFFAIMLIPLWRGARIKRRRGIAWLVAGGVALAVQCLVPGWWFIIAGAIAGALAEGFADEGAGDER
jgi:4-azaleucine resistance transporter AzlC